MENRQRVGLLVELPPLLSDLDQDPSTVCANAGIDGAALRDPESTLSFDEVGRLFRACVEETQCQHFGLLLGQRSATRSLALVGRLMRNAPTLKQAMMDLCTNQPRYVRGSVVYLVIRNDAAFWGFGVHHPGMEAVEHVSEAAISVGVSMMRELVGRRPDQVLLARRPPPDLDPYQRLLGVIPQFEAEQNAIVFSTDLLASPILGANQKQREALEKTVATYWALKEPNIVEQVNRILRARVIFGDASLANVASVLSMHPRTLNRRLLAEGKSFRDLLSEARCEVARQLLSVTTMKITAIAQALGYANPSAFTRAFERWSGMPPSAWPRQ